MRSELFGENLEAGTQDRFVLQNPRLLRIGLDGDVMARQGSMVAYQESWTSPIKAPGEWGGSSRNRSPARGAADEGERPGDLFLADDASEIHLITLEGDGSR